MFDLQNSLDDIYENRNEEYITSLSKKLNKAPANPISSGGPEYQVPNYQSAL